MTGQSSAPIQDVITAILGNVDQDRMALFASLQDHPMLQEAQAFARDGQPERFLYALPYPLERVVDGATDRPPGKTRSAFHPEAISISEPPLSKNYPAAGGIWLQRGQISDHSGPSVAVLPYREGSGVRFRRTVHLRPSDHCVYDASGDRGVFRGIVQPLLRES